ncbi:unnamed protein product [Prorocentrum cordatum]|nr:unnamed protein product [Polarella glacialis]
MVGLRVRNKQNQRTGMVVGLTTDPTAFRILFDDGEDATREVHRFETEEGAPLRPASLATTALGGGTAGHGHVDHGQGARGAPPAQAWGAAEAWRCGAPDAQPQPALARPPDGPPDGGHAADASIGQAWARVDEAWGPAEPYAGAEIFVKDVPAHWEEDDLRRLHQSARVDVSTILKIRFIPKRQNATARAVVHYSAPWAAHSAIRQLGAQVASMPKPASLMRFHICQPSRRPDAPAPSGGAADKGAAAAAGSAAAAGYAARGWGAGEAAGGTGDWGAGGAAGPAAGGAAGGWGAGAAAGREGGATASGWGAGAAGWSDGAASWAEWGGQGGGASEGWAATASQQEAAVPELRVRHRRTWKAGVVVRAEGILPGTVRVRLDGGEEADHPVDLFEVEQSGRPLGPPLQSVPAPAEPGVRVRNMKTRTGRIGVVCDPAPDSWVGDGYFAVRFEDGDTAVRQLEMFRTLDGRRLVERPAAHLPRSDSTGSAIPQVGLPVRNRWTQRLGTIVGLDASWQGSISVRFEDGQDGRAGPRHVRARRGRPASGVGDQQRGRPRGPRRHLGRGGLAGHPEGRRLGFELVFVVWRRQRTTGGARADGQPKKGGNDWVARRPGDGLKAAEPKFEAAPEVFHPPPGAEAAQPQRHAACPQGASREAARSHRQATSLRGVAVAAPPGPAPAPAAPAAPARAAAAPAAPAVAAAPAAQRAGAAAEVRSECSRELAKVKREKAELERQARQDPETLRLQQLLRDAGIEDKASPRAASDGGGAEAPARP